MFRRISARLDWPWVFLGFGVALRAVNYLANRSLWTDECSIAFNIVTRSFAGLLGPLDSDQGAPLGFLMVEKAAVLAFGNHELALRLYPFLASLAALFLFSHVARQVLLPAGYPLALGLFAVSDRLIYFATEAKQYGSDTFFAVLILAVALPILNRGLTARRGVMLALVGVISIIFSHPAVFMLAGAGLPLAWQRFRESDWKGLAGLAAVGAVWLAVFALAFAFSLRQLGQNQYLMDYWRGYFLYLPRSLGYVNWIADWFFSLFRNPGGFQFAGLAAFAFSLGAVAFWRENRVKFWLLALPFVICLAAAALHRYPFGDRLVLFLVPLMLLFVSQGGAWLYAALEGRKLPATILVGLLCLHPVLWGALHLAKPMTREEIKPVLRYLADQRRAGDTIYVYYGALNAASFYGPRYGLRPGEYLGAHQAWRAWANPTGIARDLDSLRGRARVWIVFSHVGTTDRIDEKAFALQHLEGLGRRRDAFEAPGASVFLYDLSAPPKRPFSPK